MEQLTCTACQRSFPSPPEGQIAVCPHCRAVTPEGASVFASDSDLSLAAVSLPVGENIGCTDSCIAANRDVALAPPQPRPEVAAVSHPELAFAAGDATAYAGGKNSRLAWQVLLTYASLITLIALFLGWQLWRRPERDQLDLPDLAPPVQKDGRVTTLIYVPSGKPLSAGHQLAVGESRRFGSLELTALGVTRGALSFEYFDPALALDDLKREPSGEVLKLHLRVRNISPDQTFVPFDRHLVYAREPDRRTAGRFKANNIVWNSEDPSETVLYLYDLSPDSDWVIAGQNLDRELAPGESVELFLPSTDGLPSELPDHLVWRFHFRKGYNRVSFRGVTTVAEVRFGLDQVGSSVSVAEMSGANPVIVSMRAPGSDDVGTGFLSSPLLP